MFYAWRTAVLASYLFAVVLAILVPDLSGGLGSYLVIFLLVPALVAAPLAIASFRLPGAARALAGLALASVALLVHAIISFAIYATNSTPPLDSLTYTMVYVELAIQFAVVLLVFLVVGGASSFARRRRAGAL